MRFVAFALFIVALLMTRCVATTDDSSIKPRNTPLTRPEMKQSLEDMKRRKPRIPLPEMTPAEKENYGEGDRGYESRVRELYMPAGEGRGGFGFGASSPGGRLAGSGSRPGVSDTIPGRESDPNMTLEYKFKTQLFWIVTRTNNCQYCMGHQESKLLGAGMTEDEIAALDFDWSQFEPAEQAAFAFGRKFTYEPHRLADRDIDALREHYTDLQILEMLLSMAGNNAINRWKEGIGVPQSENGGGFGRRPNDGPGAEATLRAHSYLTPTPERFQDSITKVAAIAYDSSGQPASQTITARPPLESREHVEQSLAACRVRTPRLPLVDQDTAHSMMPESWTGPVPQWARLLANFPTSARSRIASTTSADTRGELSPVLKAQVSWIIARQDRAWYAAGLAKERLQELGQSQDEIYRLDGDWLDFSPVERAMFTVARKLAASPVVLTDADVDNAVKLVGPRDVVQLISYTANRASFDRITEAAGLQLGP